MASSLAALPFEVIVLILLNLDSPDVLNVGAACKSLQSCAAENSIWFAFTKLFRYWRYRKCTFPSNSSWVFDICFDGTKTISCSSVVEGAFTRTIEADESQIACYTQETGSNFHSVVFMN
jgi:hypothetical protein